MASCFHDLLSEAVWEVHEFKGDWLPAPRWKGVHVHAHVAVFMDFPMTPQHHHARRQVCFATCWRSVGHSGRRVGPLI